MSMYRRSLHYFSQHPMLNSIAHSAAGFGLAIILQEYLQGNPFVCSCFGWVLIAFSAVVHIRSVMK